MPSRLPMADRDGEAGTERRQEERLAYFSELEILLPAGASGNGIPEVVPITRVWCQNVSHSGLSFLCKKQLTEERIQIRCPQANNEIAEFQIVRHRQLGEGLWEYGGFVVKPAGQGRRGQSDR